MHSHLIPGVDDGSDSVKTSILLLKGLVEMGYKKVITTPHIRPDYFPNQESDIENAFARLKEKVSEKGLKIEMGCAAEYYIDHTFGEKINSGNLLTFSGNHVLVELSTLAAPPNFEKYIFQMSLKGYRPVLAHPERYIYFKGLDQFEKFSNLGCLLQLNLLSLTGHYGKSVKELALALLNADLVDFLGTDMHHQRHLESLKKMTSNRSLMRVLSRKEYQNNLI